MEARSLAEQYYVYLACCANGTLYVGYTRDVSRRIAIHNAGYGGRYTRSNRPVSLLAAWPFNSKAEALRAEQELKSLPPERKRAMAEMAQPLQGEER